MRTNFFEPANEYKGGGYKQGIGLLLDAETTERDRNDDLPAVVPLSSALIWQIFFKITRFRRKILNIGMFV